MNNAFELLVGSAGAGACWILWFYFIKEHRIDTFREELFKVRHDLFCMAASEVISFESRSYVELRELINGMIQFGHHISLRSSWIASKLFKDDPNKSSAYQRWRESVESEPENIRFQLISIHRRMFHAYLNYLVRGSIVLRLMAFPFVVKGAARALRSFVLFKKKTSRFDIMDVAVNRIASSFNAQALEEQAYRDQNPQDLLLA